MTLGTLIRSTRIRHGMSLDDVAAVTGASKSTLSRVERGLAEPRLFLVLQISQLLGLRVNKMIDALKETT